MPANEKSGRPARPAPASRAVRPTAAKSTKESNSTKVSRTTKAAKPKGGKAGTSRTTLRRMAADKSSPPGIRRKPARREPAPEVVLGAVPVASRMVGGLGILGGLLLSVAVLLPHLAVGAERVVLGDSAVAALASWSWPLVIVTAGVSVVLGWYPRLGLAALGVAAAVSAAGLVGELYWASGAADRGRFEIIAGRRLLTSEVEPLAGWYVGVAGLSVLVLTGIAVGWFWSRVVMDDSESLEPGRPLLGGLAAVTGVAAVFALSATLVGIPDQVLITQQPIAGDLRPVQSLLPVEGAIGLLGRPGLALTAGLILSAVLVLFSVFATTLRPRLAVVGALAAFTGYLTGQALRAIVEAARSEEIEFVLGGYGLILVCLGYAALTLLALRWHPPVGPVSRGLPMRAASRRALKRG
ncbi:MAG: hypothetical protein M3313_15070 [Actinomycetota bacterium]|nr:hypothetical protein [Actinomycetota bacterium]